MGTPATLDDVMEAVCNSRAEGDEALAATALLLGAAMVRASVHIRVLDKRLDTTGERIAQVESERDAALAARDAAQSALAVAKLAADKDREFLRLARDDAEMFAGQRDAAIARAEQAVQEREGAERERDALTMRLSAAERERDEARAERDAALARPTYVARTVAPTRRELERHKAEHGRWLVTWQESPVPSLCSEVVAGVWPTRTYPVGAVYLPLDASGLPCAWPVVPTPEAP